MVSIVSSNSLPHLLAQYQDWIEREWSAASPVKNSEGTLMIPDPLLAIEQGALMGGLGFTSFAKPNSDRLGVWVNTLYVAPQYRNRGLGSALIHAAESTAQNLGIDELFVYTEIPALYEKLNWRIVDLIQEATVLRKAFK